MLPRRRCVPPGVPKRVPIPVHAGFTLNCSRTGYYERSCKGSAKALRSSSGIGRL